jgi:RNA polymerase sigma-70 factor (sigma-E family)
MDQMVGKAGRRRFDRFVDEVTDDLVRTGYLMTWDLDETEDLVQETLLRVARRWARVESMDHPTAYARRILVNLVIDGQTRRRRLRHELAVDADGVSDRPADTGAGGGQDGIDDAAEFRWALATLPRRQRVVIVLRYWEDLPEAEVAEILGCSRGTVKSTASRGMARLRLLLAVDDRLGAAVTTPSTPGEEKGASS